MPNSTSAGGTASDSRDILESLATSDCMLTAKELAKLLAVSPKTPITGVQNKRTIEAGVATGRFGGAKV
jgi:hypothetical protein